MRLTIIILLAATLFSACQSSKNSSSNIVKLKQNDAEYKVLKKGNGKSSKVGDVILFSFILKGNNGKTISERTQESAWAKEDIKAVDSTTVPLYEMLYSLEEGDSIEMRVPNEKNNPSQHMEGIDTFIYYIKAEEILTKEELDKKIAEKKAEAKLIEEKVGTGVAATLEQFKTGKLKEKLQKTENGVEIYFNEKGNGPKVEKGNKVAVAYYGVLKEDGKMFDNSFGRGQDLPFQAGMGQMIKGWDEAMMDLHQGDKATIFIPWKMAYGENGRPPVIPAKADLVFYLEVNKVEK